MTKLRQNLPLSFRITVYLWVIANAIILGLFIIGPVSYRVWFTDNGMLLELVANVIAIWIGGHVWQDRRNKGR